MKLQLESCWFFLGKIKYCHDRLNKTDAAIWILELNRETWHLYLHPSHTSWNCFPRSSYTTMFTHYIYFVIITHIALTMLIVRIPAYNGHGFLWLHEIVYNRTNKVCHTFFWGWYHITIWPCIADKYSYISNIGLFLEHLR